MRLFYSVYVIAARAKRSVSTARQWLAHMPAPDGVLVGNKESVGWELETWRRFALSRTGPKSADLQKDLLRVVEELQAEEALLLRRHMRD